MADLDHVLRLTNVRDQYVSLSDMLIQFALEGSSLMPTKANAWERWATLVEQRRELFVNDIGNAIDAELRGG